MPFDEEEGKMANSPGKAQAKKMNYYHDANKMAVNSEPIQLQKLLDATHTTKAQEQLWKRQLIEHDIRLQNAKLQVQELQYENKIADMRQLLQELADKN